MMNKYISALAIILFHCCGAAAQNYNAGALHVNGDIYDASAGSGSLLATNSNLVIGSGGTWLLNGTLFTTPRLGVTQAELIQFRGGTYSRTTGYINGYAEANDQAAGFVMPIGHSIYMPLTINSALPSGSPLVAAWDDAKPLSSTYVTDPGSGTTVQFYFLPGYYDIRTAGAGLSVSAAMHADAIAGTRILGTADGSNFVDLGPAGTSVTLPAGNYQLRFANSSAVLPLGLISFNASKQGSTGLISWETTNEQNVQSFTVERSADGRHFTTVGIRLSQGNTTQNRSYTLLDQNPLKGANFYRLKITERGGKHSYSAIRLLNFDALLQIAVYPNPVQDIATISGLETGMQVVVISMQGQHVIRQKASGNTEQIRLKNLSASTYEINVQDANGKLIGRYRIVKE